MVVVGGHEDLGDGGVRVVGGLGSARGVRGLAVGGGLRSVLRGLRGPFGGLGSPLGVLRALGVAVGLGRAGDGLLGVLGGLRVLVAAVVGPGVPVGALLGLPLLLGVFLGGQRLGGLRDVLRDGVLGGGRLLRGGAGRTRVGGLGAVLVGGGVLRPVGLAVLAALAALAVVGAGLRPVRTALLLVLLRHAGYAGPPGRADGLGLGPGAAAPPGRVAGGVPPHCSTREDVVNSPDSSGRSPPATGIDHCPVTSCPGAWPCPCCCPAGS